MKLLFQRATLTVGAIALTTCLPAAAAEEAGDEEIEETQIAVAGDEDEEEAEDIETVVVTGSFIRRQTFDLPSPTDTIDEVDLEFAGTPDIGDVIFDQTYQVGVNANAAPFEFGGGDDQGEQAGAEVFANLRGLGTRATMTMMDGHRVPANVQGYSFWTRRAGTDVTNLYPSIAIGRVETILDGASALYGSEAVSGVVNFIPRKNFEGLEVRYEVQQQVEDGTPSKSIGLLAGAQGERTSAIFAMEIRDEERWEATARPEFIVSSTGWTGQMLPTYGESDRASPGNWRVPHRSATGELEVPPLAGWKNFPNPADAREGFVASSGPWFLYPSLPGQNNYFLEAPANEQSVRDGRRVYGATFNYEPAMNDTTGELRTVPRYDPGCGFHFGAGHDDLGDPATANEFGLGYNDAAKKGNFLNGYTTGNVRGIETRSLGDERGSHGSAENCRQVTSDWQDLRARSDRQSGMGYFEHEFNDYFTVRGELVASSMEYDSRDRAYQIDEWNQGNTFFGPDVAVAIGSNPGNPYRAFADGSNACDYMPTLAGCDEFSPYGLRLDLANREFEPIPGVYHADTFLSYIDANGDNRYNYMEEAGELLVYAQDTNGDGLPDRDLNGDGMVDAAELGNVAAQKDPAYRVLLLSMEGDSDGDGVPDRFDPDSHGNGGVRLFEDVRMRMLAPHPKQPYVHESYPWLNPDMSMRRKRAIDNLRMRVGSEIQIPDTEWLVDADWIWARSERTHDYLEPVWTWTIASLRCQGGRPQGGSQPQECWNPFSTSWLDSDPETGEILPAWRDKDDPAWNTEIENRRAGIIMRQDQRETDTNIIDLVASNASLFDLWYNDTSVGLAVGFHFRSEAEEQRPNQVGNASIGSALSTEQKTEETTHAVFAEMQIFPIDHPFWGEMEVQAAIRYAEFEGTASFAEPGQTANFDVVIPKIAMRYQPTDWLAIRGSRTEGFVLPGMFQLFNSADYSNQFGSVNDYLCRTAPDVPHCAAGQYQPEQRPGVERLDPQQRRQSRSAGGGLGPLERRLFAALPGRRSEYGHRLHHRGLQRTGGAHRRRRRHEQRSARLGELPHRCLPGHALRLHQREPLPGGGLPGSAAQRGRLRGADVVGGTAMPCRGGAHLRRDPGKGDGGGRDHRARQRPRDHRGQRCVDQPGRADRHVADLQHQLPLRRRRHPLHRRRLRRVLLARLLDPDAGAQPGALRRRQQPHLRGHPLRRGGQPQQRLAGRRGLHSALAGDLARPRERRAALVPGFPQHPVRRPLA